MWDKSKKLITQLPDVVPKPITPLTIQCLSESIMQVGTPNFLQAIATATGAEVINSTQGASCIANQLCEMADEVYINMTGDNTIIQSNDFTQAAWTKIGVPTITKVNLDDGTSWNKIVKNSTGSYECLSQVVTIPAGFTGAFMSVEVEIPVGTTPAPVHSVSFNLNNTSKSNNATFKDFGSLVEGRRYKLGIFVPAATLATWASGDSITIYIRLNALDGSGAGTIYVRNVELSFTTPHGFQNYVPTLAAAVAAGASALTKAELNTIYYRDVDVIMQSAGRNDSATVNKYSFHRALDKLIAQCVRKCQTVIIGNCPPHVTSGAWSGSNGNDGYVNKGYMAQFKRVMAKWNIGINIYQLFLDAVTSGGYSIAQLMLDTVHPTGLAVTDIMVPAYNKEIQSGRKPTSNAQPELKNLVKYIKSGVNTGSWILEAVTGALDDRLLGTYKTGIFSSSATNDTIVYSGITAEQLWIMYRIDPTYGTFDVIVDEGTAKARTFSFDCNVAGTANWSHGHFICDYLDCGTHTIKIKVTSTAKPVKILGLVTI